MIRGHQSSTLAKDIEYQNHEPRATATSRDDRQADPAQIGLGLAWGAAVRAPALFDTEMAFWV